MSTKDILKAAFLTLLVLQAPTAYAQYEEEPSMEGYVGGNVTIPIGHIKNDLDPDSLNAKTGFGLDLGLGRYFNPHLIAGLYFNARSMGAEGFSLSHRVFELGAYGKYLISDMAEARLSPYLKISAGLNLSKLVTKVYDDGQPVYRELSYKPTLGTAAGLGVYWRTNEHGGVYLESAFHFDLMDNVTGRFESVDYKWINNNTYILIKAGVVFNIGSKE